MIFMSPRRQLVVAVLQVVINGTHSSRIRAGPSWTHLCEGEERILRIQWGGRDMKDRNIKKNFGGCRTWEGLLNLRNMGYMMYTASSEMLQKSQEILSHASKWVDSFPLDTGVLATQVFIIWVPTVASVWRGAQVNKHENLH